jgi:hypothetical protein
MRIITRFICLTLATALSSTMAPAAPAAQQAVEEIQQLDEIWVRGKHLTVAIEDAEDAFFKIYNKVNKKNEFDIFCGVTSLDRGSMIMIRKCVPGFIVYNSYSVMTNTVSIGGGFSGGCSSNMSSFRDMNGDPYYMASCSGSGYDGNAGYPTYQPVSASLLLMERGPAYARNVVNVVSKDLRLINMANGLVDLYEELELTQHHYVKVKEAQRRAMPAKPAGKPARPRNAGPRVL